MAFTENELNSILSKYLFEIKELGYNIEEAYLFGSYAKKSADVDSDIDVALISNDFEGNRFFDTKKIRKAKFNTSIYLSPFPFNKRDFLDDDDWLVQEIKKTGIRLV